MKYLCGVHVCRHYRVIGGQVEQGGSIAGPFGMRTATVGNHPRAAAGNRRREAFPVAV